MNFFGKLKEYEVICGDTAFFHFLKLYFGSVFSPAGGWNHLYIHLYEATLYKYTN